MLKPSDEYRHERTSEPNWQENYVWHAWDPDTRSGWYFHLGHIPDHGMVDVRCCVIINGKVTSIVTQSEGDDCLAAPGLDITFIKEFERVKMRYDSRGARGTDEAGWFGNLPGNTPFGFEMELETKHPVLEWAPHFHVTGWGRVDMSTSILPGQTERPEGVDPGNHYECAAAWKGKLWSGDDEVVASGLLIRDHSWGPRGWNHMIGYWPPMVFNEGKTLISGAVGLWDDWQGFSIHVNETGIVDIVDDLWVRFAGGPEIPRQFRTAEVLRQGDGICQKFRFDIGKHMPMMRHNSFLTAPEHRMGFCHVYSTITGGEGFGKGFGTVQLQPTEPQLRKGHENPLPEYADEIGDLAEA